MFVQNLITANEIKNYKLNEFPLVHGEKTEMKIAIKKLKNNQEKNNTFRWID